MKLAHRVDEKTETRTDHVLDVELDDAEVAVIEEICRATQQLPVDAVLRVERMAFAVGVYTRLALPASPGAQVLRPYQQTGVQQIVTKIQNVKELPP